jgi:acyl carrier protein
MLRNIAEHFASTRIRPKHLKDVIAAGEQLRIDPEIIHLFSELPDCRLHNHYGPTETHVVTSLTLAAPAEQWPALPTIGRPIANTQIYILGSAGQPLPLGVVGEIYIGGANVARGYLHRPDLTERRFVRDPFSADEQARMYKTGDLGLWRDDGTIEYLGRNDDQVKMRGFRIELGEIEAQLALHEHVNEVAVVAREDVPGDKRLVAYVTPRHQCRLNAVELRAHAETALPEHMVPSAFVILEKMPLTPSGKLSRRVLPAPGAEAYANRSYEAPQGATEERLAGIWQEVLRTVRVGRQDSFFELGGHSLLAMQVIARLQAVLNIDMPIRVLMQFPRLQQFASKVEEWQRNQLFEEFASSDEELEDLQQQVATMPDSNVQELLRKLSMEERP